MLDTFSSLVATPRIPFSMSCRISLSRRRRCSLVVFVDTSVLHINSLAPFANLQVFDFDFERFDASLIALQSPLLYSMAV